MSQLTLGGLLVVGWMLLWGDAGVGPFLGGSVVIAVLYVVFPSSRRPWPRLVVHPGAALALVTYVLRQIVVSNLRLTREVLRRSPGITSLVVAVPMRTTSPTMLTMVCNLAALTPGTMVVTVDAELPELRVHVLMFGGDDGPSAAIASIHELEERSVLAFAPPEDRERFLAARDRGRGVPA